jgi:Flp pilus assembly protein TadD
MKRVFVTAGLLLALALLAGEARAQTGAARGKVVDEKGQAIADAKIQIEFLGGVTRKFEVKTNKRGEFTQVGMFPGVYKFTASKEGYQTGTIEFRVTLGEPTQIPDFRLMSVKAVQEAGAGKQAELQTAFKHALELTQAGNLDEAEAAYKELLAKQPDIPEVYHNLGYVYGQKKDWAQAEASYQKAMELKPGYAEAITALAKLYQDNGKADKAMELMSKAAADYPEDAKLLFNLGIFYLNAGQSEEARKAFEKVATLDPENAEVQYHLGTLHVGQNEVPQAIEHLEKYLAMNPQNPQNVATAKGLLAALKPKK